MIVIYRFFYFLISSIAIVIKPFCSDNLKKWINLRQNNSLLSRKANSQRILFHAASGEIEYVKSVIRQIKKTDPELEIFVSYSSPSAENLFLNIKEHVTQFIPLPWDKPTLITDFLTRLNPDIIVFSRTDFWPELIAQAHQKKIPMLAVSLFPSMSWLQNIWLKFILSKMSFISVVQKDLAEKIKQLLDGRVETAYLPDTRIDQTLHRLTTETRVEIVSNKKIIVFGSTWPEDEVVLLNCIDNILNQNFKIIWCPHDVSADRITALKKQLTTYSVALFSDHQKTNLNHPYQFDQQILILDQIGYLADMYRYSQLAFVGGAFKSKVHSVMEPLSAGNPVIVGPYYENNPEAIEFMNLGYVASVRHPEQLMEAFRQFSKIEKQPIIDSIHKMGGASVKTAEIILNYLKMTS